MNDEEFKQKYAFVNLGVMIAWGLFCAWITYRAAVSKLVIDILTSAGVNVLLGAMIVWHGNIVQFFYRRAKPNGEPK